VRLKTLRWEHDAGWSAAFDPADDTEQTAIIAFGSAAADRVAQPLAELSAAHPTAALIGCSTAGEVHDDLLLDDSLVVAICRFESTSIRVATQQVGVPADSRAVGLALSETLSEQLAGLSTIFVLSDGIGVNGSTLVEGLAEGAGEGVTVSGGLAADGPRFEKTWVLVDGEARSGYVAALGLAGPRLRVGHGSAGGWDVLGPERRVTRSVGNVLYELDGQPALELYKRYLGDRAAELPAAALLFPLSIRDGRDDEHAVLRTILGVDEDEQSMTFAGDVAQGSFARLMRATFDRLVDGAQTAARNCGTQPAGQTLAVAVSCVGRRLVLGRHTEEELEATLAEFPAGTEMIGYYSYGEISPALDGSDLLNQTMTLTTFQELADA
jgi:hypothetical protein